MTSPADFSVKRPITIIMIFLAVILIGSIAMFRLPVELLPNFSFGNISIFVDIRGGMPAIEVEKSVAKPIEDAMGGVSHLINIISISEEGRCRVVLKFEPGSDMDFAALEVRERMARIREELPPETERPVIAKYEQTDVPIVIMAATGPGYTPEKLRKLVDESIKDELLRVDGVANIEVGGGRERKILVEISQDALQRYNIPISKVIDGLSVNNLNLLLGEVEEREGRFLLRAMGEFDDLNDIKMLPVVISEYKTIVRLRDVAEVKDSYLEARSLARVNALPVVSLYIQKETLANTIKVTQGIKKKLDELKESLDLTKQNIKILITYNQADSIERAIKSVRQSLLLGAFLSGLVLLLFLRDWRSLVIIVTTIPVSVLATFAIIYLYPQRITLNIMTLSGLALGIGMLVDNSIVVLENIFKIRPKAADALGASVAGTNEMVLAIIASTITTVCVFLPIVYVNKEIRILYSGIALTVTFSLLTSLVVAVTLVPVMFSKMESKDVSKRILGYSREYLWGVHNKYRRLLPRAMRNAKALIITMLCAFVVAVVLLLTVVEKEFIGAVQAEDFTVFVELPTGSRLGISDDAVSLVEKTLSGIKEIKTISSRVEPWSSKVYVKLHPLRQRRRSTIEIIDSLRPKVKEVEDKFPGAFIYFEEPEQVETNEVLIEIYGYDYDILNDIAASMVGRMQQVKGLTDLKIRWRKGGPEYRIKIDKKKAAMFGLTVEDVSEILHTQMRGLRATLYHAEGKEIEVIGRLRKEDRQTLQQLGRLSISLPDGNRIYLEQIAKFVPDISPGKIWRTNKNRMIQVSANRGRHAFGTAVKKIQKSFKGLKMPEDYFYRFGENYQKMLENQKQLTFVLFLVLILIYLVLASLFESFRQPLIIMSTVPLAIIGVVLSLMITRSSINIGALMGLVMLGGIVVNNAIIMIDHMNNLRKQGISLVRAVMRGATDRLRPVLMTTSTTILGLLPLALDRSEESALWSPLAITVIGGLTISTLLTLFIVPNIYLFFETKRN